MIELPDLATGSWVPRLAEETLPYCELAVLEYPRLSAGFTWETDPVLPEYVLSEVPARLAVRLDTNDAGEPEPLAVHFVERLLGLSLLPYFTPP